MVSKLDRNEKDEEIMLLVKENLFSSLLDKPTFGESIEIPCIEPNFVQLQFSQEFDNRTFRSG